MFSKPKSYYEGYKAGQTGKARNSNPYLYAGKQNRGNEVWWYTGFDAARDELKESIRSS